MMQKPHKVLITGTGRAGTSIIMAILTLLKYDTGFTEGNVIDYLNSSFKAGLEGIWNNGHYIHKQPLIKLEFFNEFEVDHVIIPMRKIQFTARSRERIQNDSKIPVAGGFVECDTYQQQLHHNANHLGFLISLLVEKDIPYTIVKFPKFIEDNGLYLYELLQKPFPDISLKEKDYYEVFKNIINKDFVNIK